MYGLKSCPPSSSDGSPDGSGGLRWLAGSLQGIAMATPGEPSQPFGAQGGTKGAQKSCICPSPHAKGGPRGPPKSCICASPRAGRRVYIFLGPLWSPFGPPWGDFCAPLGPPLEPSDLLLILSLPGGSAFSKPRFRRRNGVPAATGSFLARSSAALAHPRFRRGGGPRSQVHIR